MAHIEDSVQSGEIELTEQEVEAIDKQLGEKFVVSAILLARRLYTSPAEQANELRWWYEVAGAIPCHTKYSRPLLAAEINRLEEQG